MFCDIYCEVFEAYAARTQNLHNFSTPLCLGDWLGLATYRGVKVYFTKFTRLNPPLFFSGLVRVGLSSHVDLYSIWQPSYTYKT